MLYLKVFCDASVLFNEIQEENELNRFDEQIDVNQNPGSNTGTGYLIVRVATARGAIPLENATVNIRAAATPEGEIREEGVPGEGYLIAALRTDRDGLAPRVALPAPPRAM